MLLLRRNSFLVVFAVSTLTCACTISNVAPEMLEPVEDRTDPAPAARDAGSAAAASADDARPVPAAPSGAVSGSGGASGQGGAGSRAPVMVSPEAGAGGNTARGGAAAAEPADAGRTPDAAQTLADPITCALDLAGCFLDPFMYEACLRTYTQRCGDPFAADGGVNVVSPACAMQTADCIARSPEKSQECLAMQDSCGL